MYDGTELYQTKSTEKSIYIESGAPSVSLSELLDYRNRKFTLKERRILAVILAHALLHFSDSSWFSEEWKKQHIKFFYRPTGYDLKRPYLTTTFKQCDPNQNFNAMERIHPNPSVLALGVLLLEIELWRKIEDSRDDRDLSPDGVADINTDLFTAKRLFDQRSDDMTMNYQRVIDACLKCRFVEPGQAATLDDEQFRHAVYCNIVEPLEDELFHACHLQPHQLGLEEPIRGGSENARPPPRSPPMRSAYSSEYDRPNYSIRQLASLGSGGLSFIN